MSHGSAGFRERCRCKVCYTASNARRLRARNRGRRQAGERALRERRLREAASKAGGRIEEALGLILRCAQALDAAESQADSRESRQAFRIAYQRLRSAEDAIGHALGVGYDESIYEP